MFDTIEKLTHSVHKYLQPYLVQKGLKPALLPDVELLMKLIFLIEFLLCYPRFFKSIFIV